MEQRSPGGQANGFRTVVHRRPIRRMRATLTRRYLVVGLYRDDGMVLKRVHRLVLETFRGPRPPGQVARHLNGRATDNRLANLVWSTQRENILDKVRHGTMPRRLTASAVQQIRQARHQRGQATATRIAHTYGIGLSTYYHVRAGRIYTI